MMYLLYYTTTSSYKRRGRPWYTVLVLVRIWSISQSLHVRAQFFHKIPKVLPILHCIFNCSLKRTEIVAFQEKNTHLIQRSL